MTNDDVQFYCECRDHLLQGDIFSMELVGPIADCSQRIYRTPDGRHGSAALSEGVGKVFSRSDLDTTLNTPALDDERMKPFCRTDDDQEEMVVVYGQMIEYFVVASQSCDISGVDRPAKPLACVLPIKTHKHICRNDKIPVGKDGCRITIEQFLIDNDFSGLYNCESHTEYRDALDQIFKCWTPTKGSDEKENWGKIKNILKNLNKSIAMYEIMADQNFDLPDGFIDFTSMFMVPTESLVKMHGQRLATLTGDYRNQFSRKLAEFFGRIATPIPLEQRGLGK